MKLEMVRADMEYGAGFVIGAVDKKKIGDYAGSILVRSLGGNRIELHATDLELFASVALEATVAEPGSVVVPADLFLQAVKGCGAGRISIQSDTDLKTVIDGSLANYELAGLDPGDYPAGSIDGVESIFGLPAGRMQACIASVMHAASNNPSKLNLCGVNMRLSTNGRLTAATTDGYRLSLATMEIPGELIVRKFRDCAFTIPNKAATLLSKITKTVSIGKVKERNRLYFEAGAITVCSAEIVEEYPDCRRIIPSGEGDVITVDTRGFIAALESVCIISDDQYRSVVLDISGEVIRISALGTTNTARSSVPCMSDCNIKLRMTSKYLLQALKSIDSDEVFIKHFGEKSPVMLIPADHGHWDERIEIIMPVALP